jgi:diaminopimelate epimerase
MLSFKKMHGLGNDFIVFDKRGDLAAHFPTLTPLLLRHLADRKLGIGCLDRRVLENLRWLR